MMNNKSISILIISLFLFTISCKIDLGKEELKQLEYKGVIIKKYRDESNRMIHTLQIKKSSTEQLDFDMDCWYQAWLYAEVGDSLIKQPNTLSVIIKGKNGISKKFRYKF